MRTVRRQLVTFYLIQDWLPTHINGYQDLVDKARSSTLIGANSSV